MVPRAAPGPQTPPNQPNPQTNKHTKEHPPGSPIPLLKFYLQSYGLKPYVFLNLQK